MRNEMHLSLLVALLVFVVSGLPSRGDMCSPGNVKEGPQPRIYTIHRLSVGDPEETRCCLRKECNAGYYAEPCTSVGGPDSTICKPCPPMTWLADNHYSDDFLRCRHWTRCLRKIGFEVKKNGSSVHDRQCRCMLREGFYPSGLEGQCEWRQSQCEEGKELNDRGHCVPCPANKYKLGVGYGPCMPCPDTHQKMVSGPGKCTPCPPGTKNLGYGCQTCEELSKQKMEHAECHPNITVVPLPVEEKDHGRESAMPKVVYIMIGLVVSILIIIIVIIVLVLHLRRRRPCRRSDTSEKETQRLPTDVSSTSSTRSTRSTNSDGSFNFEHVGSEKQSIDQFQQYEIPTHTPTHTYIQATFAIVGSNNALNNNCSHDTSREAMSGENFAYPGNESPDGRVPHGYNNNCSHDTNREAMSGKNFAYPGNESPEGRVPHGFGSEC